MSKNIRYCGIDLVLFDKNSTGNYRVYKALSGHKFMFSYDSLIVISDMVGNVMAVTNDYRYSNTTGRHLYKFCDEYTNTTSKDVRLKESKVSCDERVEKVVNCLSKIKQDVERWS